MTNYDRALAVLEAARRPGDLRIHPHDAVEALAKAGLLAPELPKPDLLSRHGWPRWQITNFGNTKETVYVDYMRGGIFINVPACNMSTHPEDTTTLAHTLLAAANHREEA